MVYTDILLISIALLNYQRVLKIAISCLVLSRHPTHLIPPLETKSADHPYLKIAIWTRLWNYHLIPWMVSWKTKQNHLSIAQILPSAPSTVWLSSPFYPPIPARKNRIYINFVPNNKQYLMLKVSLCWSPPHSGASKNGLHRKLWSLLLWKWWLI